MTIPTHRRELVDVAEARFAELERLLDAIAAGDAPPAASADAAAAEPMPAPRDRDAVDVVNHLHAWHVLLLGWLEADAAGRAPAFPADGYSWRELDALNRDLRDRLRADGDLDAARGRLRASHGSALARLDVLDDPAIFDASKPWLKGATLAEPVHECLGGHYGWALGVLPALPARAG